MVNSFLYRGDYITIFQKYFGGGAMLDFKAMFDYTANVIYKAAIDEEKEWRKEGNPNDIKVMDQLLKQVRALGYRYRYFVDITNRENNDKILWDLLLGYIGQFEDDYFSAALVGVVGKKGNTFATEIILKSYMGLSDDSKRMHAGFYDNALKRIKDKRYLTSYMELLKSPKDASKLPLTMIMLGRWQLEEAKPYFFEYLNADNLYNNKDVGSLVYIALQALSFYPDQDGIIMKALEDKLNSNNKDLVNAAQKAIKRLNKRNIR